MTAGGALADRLVERAEQQSGFSSFHSPSYRDGLAVLAHEIETSAHLSPEGRGRLEESMVADLGRRLAVDDHLRRHPLAAEAAVEAPIFVMGMPRTGTTLLINLLAQDERNRSPLKWEVAQPAPPAAAGALRSDPRCLAQRDADREAMAAHGWASAHFEFADEPRECVFLLAHDLRAMSYEAAGPFPGYSALMMEGDMTSAYAVHRRTLQVLQSGNPGRWTLKAPSHALWIDALLRVYPDARLVWTHRDPLVAVASMCSLISKAQASYCGGTADGEWIRRHYPAYAAEHALRPLAALERFGDRIHQIHYADLTRDPVGALGSLYEWMDDTLTPEHEAQLRGWIAENPATRLGQHTYSLEDFGLTTAEVAPLFDEYLAAVPVEVER